MLLIKQSKCTKQGDVGIRLSDLGSEFFFGGLDDPPPSCLIWYVLHTYVCFSVNNKQRNHYIHAEFVDDTKNVLVNLSDAGSAAYGGADDLARSINQVM